MELFLNINFLSSSSEVRFEPKKTLNLAVCVWGSCWRCWGSFRFLGSHIGGLGAHVGGLGAHVGLLGAPVGGLGVHFEGLGAHLGIHFGQDMVPSWA